MRPLTRIGFVISLLALSPAPHAQQPPSAVTLPGLEQALDQITVTAPAPSPTRAVPPQAPIVTPPTGEQVAAPTPAPASSPAPRAQQTALSIEQVADKITAAGWKIVLLASLGGTLEFYDFVIFGVFARDIADAVFPASDPLVSLILSYATFAVGYLARPIGGIVLSHFGDRYGRRRVFLISIFIMSGATRVHFSMSTMSAL